MLFSVSSSEQNTHYCAIITEKTKILGVEKSTTPETLVLDAVLEPVLDLLVRKTM